MRPVNKGDHPQENGKKIVFKEYSDARPFLIDRLGDYCSYCEMQLDAGLAVEHVKPKSLHPDLELEWSNFLLACPNCNPTKNAKDVVLQNYFWPDVDNTSRAFVYDESGIVRASDKLTRHEFTIAEATIKLTGLHKDALNSSNSDRRWMKRRNTWRKATHSKERLQRNDSEELREQIVETVHGYWSIWMTVFKDDKDMLQRFITSFPGTCVECFDDNGSPIPRNRNGL